ncbi:phage tail sheath subtilisin-like domain-containing protein [Fluviibacterium sp. DFM31]|uniref:Phage tail sheath subtilisin-like domain-containing protein n=1 Tax=Meridianimarinicoccus marinus TaxID=3231483 RepID=A0ABV3L6V1_9RHOB
MGFLHGIETLEIDSGLRPIRLADFSTIGVVGTAPNAAGATAATLTVGTAAANNLITLTAASAGGGGNAVSFQLVDPGAANAALDVDVTGSAITVTLATDAGGAVTSTAAGLITAINADVAASALVAATGGAGNGGGAAKRMLAARNLSGGADEPFPLNTPVLISGRRIEAAGLGDTGTLPEAIDAIFDQVGARVVVVRVAEGGDAAGTLANIIGGVDAGGNNLGVQAFLDAKALAKVTPRILIAPGFSQNTAVVSELVGIADRLRAVVIADGPNTTDAEAITFREQFGSQRILVVDPWVKVFDTALQTEVAAPPSARVAGVIARTDQDKGFWWSPSNQLIGGITGTARPVSFGLSDPTCRANLLNENAVTTVVQESGFRIWGNRSTTPDALWTFLSVRRTADVIEDSIEAAHLWAMDRPFSAQLIRDIRDGVAAFLRRMEALGAILGGTVWIDEELNTEATLKGGQLYLDYDFEPPAPLERLTFRAHRNGDYYEDLVAQVVSAS